MNNLFSCFIFETQDFSTVENASMQVEVSTQIEPINADENIEQEANEEDVIGIQHENTNTTVKMKL